LAQLVQGLVLTKATQLEMADLKDRCRNFRGESTGHEQWPPDILAEKFQPAEDVKSRSVIRHKKPGAMAGFK
jgi:hypothetical protein